MTMYIQARPRRMTYLVIFPVKPPERNRDRNIVSVAYKPTSVLSPYNLNLTQYNIKTINYNLFSPNVFNSRYLN